MPTMGHACSVAGEDGCSEEAIDAVEQAIGRTIPTVLAAFYRAHDGWFDDHGQYWMIWPLGRLAEDNHLRWDTGTLDRGLLAFGDDGTGDPFCMVPVAEGVEVIHWNAIDHEADERWPALDEFLAAWCPLLDGPR